MRVHIIRMVNWWQGLFLPLIVGIIVLITVFGFQNPVLSVALAGVLWWSLIGLWKPRLTLFVFLALLPFVDFLKRLQLAFTDPSSLEWNLILAMPDILLLSTAAGVVLKRMKEGHLAIRLNKTDWWLLAFMGSMLVSIVHSVFPLMVGVAAFKLSGFYILVYFLAPALITEEKHLRFLLKMTFVLSSIAALYGLWQLAFGMTSFEKKWLTGGYTGLSEETIIYFAFRPFSTLSSPAAYAYYLVIGLVLGLAYVQGFVPPGKRTLKYIGISLVALALGLSLTRSALLLFVLVWLLVKVNPKEPIKTGLFLAFLIISSVLVLLRFGSAVQSMALNSSIPFVQRTFIVGTLGDRLRGWQGIMTDLAYWTPLGYGLGVANFTLMNKYGLSFELFSHDEYTNILLEQGVIGVFLFIGFVFLWMRNIYRRLYALKTPALKLVGRFLFALCLSILIIGLMGSNLKVSPVNTYFWLVAGLLSRSTVFASSQNNL